MFNKQTQKIKNQAEILLKWITAISIFLGIFFLLGTIGWAYFLKTTGGILGLASPEKQTLSMGLFYIKVFLVNLILPSASYISLKYKRPQLSILFSIGYFALIAVFFTCLAIRAH